MTFEGNYSQERILVIGSTGFIGTHILSICSNMNTLVLPNEKLDMESKLQLLNPTIIINAVASKITALKQGSLESNFNFPKLIFSKAFSFNPNLRWVQLASYYELQQVYGRSDYYTHHKSQFRDFINSSPYKNQVVNLILPHVAGPNENSSRLFSTLALAEATEKIVLGSDGKQFIPVVHVLDSIIGIMTSLEVNSGTYSIPPVWYGRIQELVTELQGLGVLNNEVEFKVDSKSVDSSYPKIKFSNPIPNWWPSRSIQDIIQDIRKNMIGGNV
jgi:nucleoside-diphosphate-sugar epimerase